MNILAIDTSGKSIAVALNLPSKPVDEIMRRAEGQHASNLQVMIDEILDRNALTLKDIDLFAVTNGPGSFTGIRIGLSAVMGMAYGCNKPVYTVSSLAVLAQAANLIKQPVATVIDARAERVYSSIYQAGESLIEEKPRKIIDFLSLLSKRYSLNENICFIGDASPLIQKYLESQPFAETDIRLSTQFLSAEKNDISAAVLSEMARDAYLRGETFDAAHEIKANYGIESAAKRNLDKHDDRR